MIFLGIDPGKSGALAIIAPSEIAVIPFDEIAYRDNLSTINRYMGGGEKAVCALEKVGAMPQQGVSSTFEFGRNFGYIEGLLVAYCIPYQLVIPAKWKKEFALLKRDKDASIAEARRLFPSVSLLPTARSRKENDGMAEALLLAEWGRRMYRGR